MSKILLGALVLTTASACSVTYPEGVIVCTDRAETECPEGWVCSAGRCYSQPVDAGADGSRPDDAGVDAPSDADAATDGGASCLFDADSADAAPAPGVGCPAVGPTDPDCSWNFGRPHAVPSLQWSSAPHWGAALGQSGLTIYVANADGILGQPIYQAARDSAADPFHPLTPTPGTARPDLAPILLTVTGDELELFAQVKETHGAESRERIVRYSRAAMRDIFSGPEPIPSLDVIVDGGGGVAQPSVTADGLELYFVVTPALVIYRATRPSRCAPFGTPRALAFGAGVTYPRVTPDGLGIFVGPRARYTTRLDRRSDFGMPTDLPVAGVVLTLPTYIPETHELWFAAGLESGVREPWSLAAR